MVNPCHQNLKQNVGENQGLPLVGNHERRKINASGIQNNEEMVNPIWTRKGAFERLDSQNPSTNHDRQPINKEHGYLRFQDKESIIHEDNVTMENLYREDHQENEVNSPQTNTVTSAHLQENIASNSNGITITRKESRALNTNRKSRFNQRKSVFEIDDCTGRIEHSDFKSTCPLLARAIKTQLASHHRTRQYILHKHYLKYPTKKEAMTHQPNGVKVAEWVLLCDRFGSKEFQSDLQTEKAISLCTLAEICIEKLGHILGHIRGRTASTKHVFETESIRMDLNSEKEKLKQLEKDHLELKENHLKL
nr:hypothetical protein [Tanacetum cinerariifolium]